MLDKNLVKAELNNIFQLLLASIDPQYLIELASKKFAGKEYGVGSIEFSKKAWNKGIQILIDENNAKNKDKKQIEVPKNYDFFGYVYNKLKGKGENQAEAQEGASWILHYCFIPGAAARMKPKIHETDTDDTLYFDKKIRTKQTEDIVDQAEADTSINDVITHFRKTLDSGKHDEKYTLVFSFQNRASEGLNKWFAMTSNLKEVQPKEKKDDDGEGKGTDLEEIAGPEKAIEEVLTNKLKKDFFDFISEEKKEGLITKDAYAFLKLKEHNPEIKKDKILKVLKIVPENIDEDKKEELFKGADKKYSAIIDEIKYIFARYAYANDDADLLATMQRKDPQGRFLLPTDSNKHFNPYQNHFTKKDINYLADFLDENYDKGYTIIKKELSKNFNSKLMKDLDTIYQAQGSVEKFLDFVEKYKKSGESDLSEYAKSLKKKSSAKVASIVEYLDELISRIS